MRTATLAGKVLHMQPEVAAAGGSFLSESMQAGFTNFIIALTSLITAIGIVLVNVIVARAKTRVVETAEKVEKKADEIGETTKTTLGHVNSAATEMRAQIAALRAANESLLLQANENRQIAAVLAATHASVIAPVLAAPAAPAAPAAAVPELKAIENNTAATVEALHDKSRKK